MEKVKRSKCGGFFWGSTLIFLNIALFIILVYCTTDTVYVRIVGAATLNSKHSIATDEETFHNYDTMFFQKYNSNELQSKIELDRRYRMQVYGSTYFGMKRNIIGMQPILSRGLRK